MPGLDATGPQGLGPMTGRGLGRCAGYAPGYGGALSPMAGVGLGLAHRRGAGWRGRFNAPAYTDEKAALEAQAKILGDRLSVVKQRLDEINRSQKEE